MGAQLSSPTFGSVAYLNTSVIPDQLVAPVTRFWVNWRKYQNMGLTTNMYGAFYMYPNVSAALMLFIFSLNYHPTLHAKYYEDQIATTIDHRHGYDNFLAMTPQEQARIKGYVRYEWRTGGNLWESSRYSPEQRIGFASNSKIIAE